MKKNIITLVSYFFISTGVLLAQETPKTLLNGSLSSSQIGFMISPGFQATQLGSDPTGYFLVKGGLVFNDKLTLGAFYGQVLDPLDQARGFASRLDSYQAGGLIEYTLHASNLFHFSFPISFGVNEIEFEDEGDNWNNEESKFLFIEPAAQIEVNIHTHARLFAGVGYRIMGGTIQQAPDLPVVENQPTFTVGLKFGLFRANSSK